MYLYNSEDPYVYFSVEHLELLERGELKSLYDAEQVEYDDEDDIDLNDEDDTEMEEPAACEELVDERFSEDEPETSKTENESEQYPVLNVSGSSEFPEFKIEVLCFNCRYV